MIAHAELTDLTADTDWTANAAEDPFHDVDESLALAKILLVDDEPFNLRVFQKHLESAGYCHFFTCSDSTKALRVIRHERPDIVLLDIMMPVVSGVDVLRELRADPLLAQTPVIVLTASTDAETKHEVLALGVTDFLNKPVDHFDLVLRVRNALRLKSFHDALSDEADRLERAVRRRTDELASSREEVITALARAAEFRDNETGNHVLRVGRYVRLIALELGFSQASTDVLEQAARLHDVGKLGIPDDILLKPDRLTAEEYEFMQRHCLFGRKILCPGEFRLSFRDAPTQEEPVPGCRSSVVLPVAATIALTHHEKWDGSGYPLGLAGEDIPIEGRITAVADVFDALGSRRPYKEPFPRPECFKILLEGRGKHFDPAVLDAFFRRRDEVLRVQAEWADED